MDQVAEASAVSHELSGQVVNVSTVAKREWSAKSIRGHLMHHGSGNLILSVREQISLEPIHPSQRLLVEQF